MQATPLQSVPATSTAQHDLIVHGYETAIALVVAFVVWRLSYAAIDRFFARRLLLRHPRISTYLTPIKSVTGFIVFIVLVLTLLNIWSVNIGPAIWSAGVITAALAFGAQFFVRDLLAGYSIFAENQFEVGDHIQIITGINSAINGTVEAIGLRTTRIVDDQGRTVFIPNGNIYVTVNFSKGHRRVVLTVKLPWRAGVDETQKQIEEIARAVATDAKLSTDDVSVTLDDFSEQQGTFSVSIHLTQAPAGVTEATLRERLAAGLQAKGLLSSAAAHR